MRAVLAIAWREVRSFFVSPAAYVVIFVFLAISTGMFVYLTLDHVASMGMQMVQGGRRSVTDGIIRPFIAQGLRSALWLVIPLISMRLLSEDRKQGTSDLLLTSPITTLQLVLGKYLGALTVMTIMMLMTVHIPLTLAFRSRVEGGVIFAGYLGVYLTGAMFLSAGTFASALTENQIVAALLAFAIIFGLVISGILAESSTRYLGGMFAPFSLRLNLQDFIAGIVDSSGLVYFLSMTGFFIFLTQRSIDSQRWR